MRTSTKSWQSAFSFMPIVHVPVPQQHHSITAKQQNSMENLLNGSPQSPSLTRSHRSRRQRWREMAIWSNLKLCSRSPPPPLHASWLVGWLVPQWSLSLSQTLDCSCTFECLPKSSVAAVEPFPFFSCYSMTSHLYHVTDDGILDLSDTTEKLHTHYGESTKAFGIRLISKPCRITQKGRDSTKYWSLYLHNHTF